MSLAQEVAVVSQPIAIADHRGCRLWIDGAGCWWLWFGKSLAIGNGAPSRCDTDRLRVYGDLQSRHAVLNRHDDALWVEPRGPVTREGQILQQETLLTSASTLQLGDDVLLSVSLPSPLSNSATLMLTSGHRTVNGLDGCVMFEQTCLIGPGDQNHIACRHWEETLVLFERSGHLWWREHKPGATPQPVLANEILGAGDWRLRVEMVD